MMNHDYLLPFNFLGLPLECSQYDTSRVVIFPVPYDSTVSFRSGTREGPQAIISASRQVELYDAIAGCEVAMELGVHTLGELIFDSRGPEPTMQRIGEIARSVLADDKFLLTLGGEHSISSPLVEACLERSKGLSVLQIDAHLDLRDAYLGSPYSHASVMRRLVARGVPVQAVGIRNISLEESEFLAGEPDALQPILGRQVYSDPQWIERALEGLTDEVYVSIDLDGLDPSVVPGVGTPEPGGLTWFDIVDLLEALAERKKIVGADVVELCPQPGENGSPFVAALLAYKLISLAHYARQE